MPQEGLQKQSPTVLQQNIPVDVRHLQDNQAARLAIEFKYDRMIVTDADTQLVWQLKPRPSDRELFGPGGWGTAAEEWALLGGGHIIADGNNGDVELPARRLLIFQGVALTAVDAPGRDGTLINIEFPTPDLPEDLVGGHIIADGNNGNAELQQRRLLAFAGDGVAVSDDPETGATVINITQLPGEQGEQGDQGEPGQGPHVIVDGNNGNAEMQQQPLLVFMGDAVAVSDDPATGATVVTVTQVPGEQGQPGEFPTVIDGNNNSEVLTAQPNWVIQGNAVTTTVDEESQAIIFNINAPGPHVILDGNNGYTVMPQQPSLSFAGDGVTLTDDDGVTHVVITPVPGEIGPPGPAGPAGGEVGPEGKGYRVLATGEYPMGLSATPALNIRDFVVADDYRYQVAYLPGTRVRVTPQAETGYAEGLVTNFNVSTNVLTVAIGYGPVVETLADAWYISVAGDPAEYRLGNVIYGLGTATIDLNTGQEFEIDLSHVALGAAGPITLTYTGARPALRSLQMRLVQPPIGSARPLRTLAFAVGKFECSYGATGVPSLTQTRGAVDLITGYFYRASTRLTLVFGPNVLPL